MDRRARSTLIALVVASVTLMELLDATILTTALPAMSQSLAVTVIDLKAAITTYLVTLSIFIPISGWIADRLGSRTTLLAAIGLFTASSAACGMARSLEALVAFRAVQGMGGTLMFLYGCCQSVFMNMINAVPFLDVGLERSSKATSLHGTVQQFSMSVGISFAALLLDGTLDAGRLALGTAGQTREILGSFHFVFLILAGISAVNCVVGLSLAGSSTSAANESVRRSLQGREASDPA